MINVIVPDVLVDPSFYGDHAALFDQLVSSVYWDDRMAARRTASFGKPYNYSQIEYSAAPIPDFLLPMVGLLHGRLGIRFNNCLLNYYQTGDNTMGFHSDDTSGLIAGTGVAIVSLGSVRDITYRSKANVEIQKSYALQPGSLLYMDELV